jgi:hypothetical protein
MQLELRKRCYIFHKKESVLLATNTFTFLHDFFFIFFELTMEIARFALNDF